MTEAPQPRHSDDGTPRPDPTKMANQPALQRSRGTIWIVMGGLFLIISLVPLGALIFAGTGRSAGVAIAAALVMIGLYAALLGAKFGIGKQRLRLRVMAGCMLAMAAVALIALWVCALIEGAPVSA
ncbi:MAG: hypothetical protein WDA07_03045 [Leucobacter sp.]